MARVFLVEGGDRPRRRPQRIEPISERQHVNFATSGAGAIRARKASQGDVPAHLGGRGRGRIAVARFDSPPRSVAIYTRTLLPEIARPAGGDSRPRNPRLS